LHPTTKEMTKQLVGKKIKIGINSGLHAKTLSIEA
jgi:hypothetical protein